MKKSAFLFTLLIFLPFFSFSQDKKGYFFEGKDDYSVSVIYNKTINPGDAVFAKLTLTSKKFKSKLKKTEGKIELYKNFGIKDKEKKLSGSKMYNLDTSKNKYRKNILKNSVSFFSGMPLSSFALCDGPYTLKINVTPFGKTEEYFELLLPLCIEEKKFEEEIIPLSPKNTAIRTEVSPVRTKQINKLNEILDTANYDRVYNLESFDFPSSATRRTSFFGDRRTFAYSDGKKSTTIHHGIDWGTPIGTEVFAPARGRVVLAEWRNSTGYSIVIEHLPNLYSIYYHLDKIKVSKGKIVDKGDLIAFSGNTGLTTGPHIHWEMRLKMQSVNPEFFTENFDWIN